MICTTFGLQNETGMFLRSRMYTVVGLFRNITVRRTCNEQVVKRIIIYPRHFREKRCC